MEHIQFVHVFYYTTVWYVAFLFFVWGTVIFYIGSQGQKLLHSNNSPSQVLAVALSLLVTWFLGLRPVSSEFGDMWLYMRNFYHADEAPYVAINLHNEWLWNDLTLFCREIGMNVYEYFLTIELGYVGLSFATAWVLTRKNLWVAMLFTFIAFQFYTYGVNGIRNGLGCALELLALALFVKPGTKRTIAYVLMLCALGIHRSTMLPSAAAIVSVYFIKDTKIALRFWMASIVISLVAGPFVEQFFGALGFDDRLTSYSQNQLNAAYMEKNFSHTGFRWDFLLYSAMPVAMIWYITKWRRFNDNTFSLIANTYLLCNAFWIMVIRASFSNRFAYLSWFMYPVVFYYPLLRMNLWEDQDRKTALILFLYSFFTFFMFFIYYFGTTGFKGFDQLWWR